MQTPAGPIGHRETSSAAPRNEVPRTATLRRRAARSRLACRGARDRRLNASLHPTHRTAIRRSGRDRGRSRQPGTKPGRPNRRSVRLYFLTGRGPRSPLKPRTGHSARKSEGRHSGLRTPRLTPGQKILRGSTDPERKPSRQGHARIAHPFRLLVRLALDHSLGIAPAHARR